MANVLATVLMRVLVCPSCGISFGMPSHLYETKLKEQDERQNVDDSDADGGDVSKAGDDDKDDNTCDRDGFSCPNGHRLVPLGKKPDPPPPSSRETRQMKKLRGELLREKQKVEQLEAKVRDMKPAETASESA